jgi:hypothetical protein
MPARRADDVDMVLAIIRDAFWSRGLGTYMKDDCGTFQVGSLVGRFQEDERTLRAGIEGPARPSPWLPPAGSGLPPALRAWYSVHSTSPRIGDGSP